MKQTALFTLIAFASLGLGSLINAFRAEPLALYYQTPAERLIASTTEEVVDQNAEEISSSGGNAPILDDRVAVPLEPRKNIQIIALEKLLKLKAKDQVLIFDVRPSLFYQLGHIPASLSFPIKEFEVFFTKYEADLIKAMEGGKEIVLYCAGPHCPDASKVAAQLRQKNLGNLSVFEGGWDEWEDSDLEQSSSM